MSDLNSVIAKLTDRKETELVASVQEVIAMMDKRQRQKRNALVNMPADVKKECKALEKKKAALEKQMEKHLGPIEDKLDKYYKYYGYKPD